MRSRDIKEIQVLTPQEKAAIEELVSMARNHFIVKDIILFGSKARGESNEHSDLDIMIIIDGIESKVNRNRLSELAFEVNYKYDTNIYAGLGYSSKWENVEYLKLPLPLNISREGVVLRV
jgi:predicted nucleotidyltransferase